jgi:hypothetical protein
LKTNLKTNLKTIRDALRTTSTVTVAAECIHNCLVVRQTFESLRIKTLDVDNPNVGIRFEACVYPETDHVCPGSSSPVDKRAIFSLRWEDGLGPARRVTRGTSVGG